MEKERASQHLHNHNHNALSSPVPGAHSCGPLPGVRPWPIRAVDLPAKQQAGDGVATPSAIIDYIQHILGDEGLRLLEGKAGTALGLVLGCRIVGGTGKEAGSSK